MSDNPISTLATLLDKWEREWNELPEIKAGRLYYLASNLFAAGLVEDRNK